MVVLKTDQRLLVIFGVEIKIIQVQFFEFWHLCCVFSGVFVFHTKFVVFAVFSKNIHKYSQVVVGLRGEYIEWLKCISKSEVALELGHWPFVDLVVLKNSEFALNIAIQLHRVAALLAYGNFKILVNQGFNLLDDSLQPELEVLTIDDVLLSLASEFILTFDI